MSGVAVNELRCPTCARPYPLPLEVQRDDNDDQLMSPSRSIKLPGPPYIECPNGHRWTLKTLYQREGHPDALLLGDYIGGGWP